ncbi:MAG TPA: penicillin-binding protein 1C [Bacteroidales bacterium]|nr:penicillin-binding protein 1C [Bacteroidales bacterium]
MRRGIKIVIGAGIMLILSVLLAPMPSFKAPLSTVVEASDGFLLGARVADDGQWRFPPPDSLPEKYVAALINYEDRWFRWHPGINPIAVIKALSDNIRAGETVRGGSTITMQVARLARGNPPRTYTGKILEMLSALKLELFRSKNEILRLYASNAPFGGNTVGLGAAAWRYTGRSSNDISWAEAAALAVLPNAPSLVYPGKNTERFRARRDTLLTRLLQRGLIDSITCSLALGEPLPAAALPMPSEAPHLTDRFWLTRRGEKVTTTIDPALQRQVNALVNSHQTALTNILVFNAAALVVEVVTGNVLAYAGNSSLPDSARIYGRDVDVIRSARSTGSIMKPFLYAGLMTGGDMLPNELVADIPTRFQGFRPENSDFTYSGAVPAGDALARSLNIPAVRMLRTMGEERFLRLLQRIGLTSFNKPASYYGLSLILGGGEASLWGLAGAYSSMARVLNNNSEEAVYQTEDWHMPLLEERAAAPLTVDPNPPLTAPAIWLTYEALRRVNRPETETGWQYFGSAPDIAWKTGTSFGFRDAWAIGTTPRYVVAVWTGNADGEGRPGLTGISAAAPLLFDIFRLLQSSSGGWFTQPVNEMTMVPVCSASGFRAGPDCPVTHDEWVPVAALKASACPYHTVIMLDTSSRYRVNISCIQPGASVSNKWFVLPPAMEYYYRMRNPSYRTLPPFMPGCSDDRKIAMMEFLYPPPDAKIFIPRSLSGETMSMLPEIAHRRRNAVIYWHLNNRYIGLTRQIHQIELLTGEGEHIITAIDNEGFTISRRFTMVRSLQ